MISLSWPSVSGLRTCFRLFDAMIVSRMISWLYFLMSSLAFFLIVMHISGYSIRLLSPFPAIIRRFIIRAHVDDDILDVCDLLIALATFDALCWIMCVMASLMVSMSSSSCSVSNHFLNSSWNSIFVDPIRVASTVGSLLVINCFLSTSKFDVAHNQSLPILTWLMTVWPVC